MLASNAEKIEFFSGGQRIVGILHFPDKKVVESRIVITCHGLMSSKDSQKYLEIARRLSSEGLAVLRFDFRGSGESEGSGNMLTDRIKDLKAGIEFTVTRGFSSIGVLGSSYGGVTAILAGSEATNVKGIVTWATPCQLKGLFNSMFIVETRSTEGNTRKTGKNTKTSQYMDDLSKHDVLEAAKKVSRILVIHCKEDKVVPWLQAKMIYENAKEPKQLKIFEKGDHQFLDSLVRKEAIELSLKWFRKYL